MASTESLVESITGPNLQGVYLHNPLDPAGTIRQFFFAPSGRQEERAITSDLLQFAGRTLPVAEFGEIRDESLDVKFLIPFDEFWDQAIEDTKTIFRANTTYAYRDNRGRTWYGVLRAIKFTDEREGTTVGFSFERVDFTAIPASVSAFSDGEGA